MAVRQFQQAASKAFEQGQLISALKVSLKAEKALKRLYIQQFGEDHLQRIEAMASTANTTDVTMQLGGGEVGLKPDIMDWLMSGGDENKSLSSDEGMTWQQFR